MNVYVVWGITFAVTGSAMLVAGIAAYVKQPPTTRNVGFDIAKGLGFHALAFVGVILFSNAIIGLPFGLVADVLGYDRATEIARFKHEIRERTQEIDRLLEAPVPEGDRYAAARAYEEKAALSEEKGRLEERRTKLDEVRPIAGWIEASVDYALAFAPALVFAAAFIQSERERRRQPPPREPTTAARAEEFMTRRMVEQRIMIPSDLRCPLCFAGGQELTPAFAITTVMPVSWKCTNNHGLVSEWNPKTRRYETRPWGSSPRTSSDFDDE
ncbi:hypothetical protein [Anaeromyxobacter terrae]|uniref:hypothetical protein n=1 Tax=Anaeromyxobacter terrae TaxID=2925406 RepID=UPI001F5710D9|nr:hypothetical protein [Anaeromyxobacter sp. SG22]